MRVCVILRLIRTFVISLFLPADRLRVDVRLQFKGRANPGKLPKNWIAGNSGASWEVSPTKTWRNAPTACAAMRGNHLRRRRLIGSKRIFERK